MFKPFKIALVGNPNAGKSSLFNALTGLNQKVGNFPGVTVDKKTGNAKITDGLNAQIIDLPGTYSLYAKSADEQVACEVLLNPNDPHTPNLVVVIADASNLKRNLLFCSQIMDLKIPVVIALTMMDLARRKGIQIDTAELERQMGVPVVGINPRRGKGMVPLRKAIADIAGLKGAATAQRPDFINLTDLAGNWLPEVQELCQLPSTYAALHVACDYSSLSFINTAKRIRLSSLLGESNFHKGKVQAEEVMQRFRKIDSIMQLCVVEETPLKRAIFSERIDKVLLHPLWGNLILLGVLFLIFQSIYSLATYPMDAVEWGFASLSQVLSSALPNGWLTDLLINGVLAGLSGIVIFIPQIMILFGFITLLEDTGYMARISFLSDRLMRSVGLNGRSVMPLISGMACAVPAVMAARSIQNKKERLITILVTPMMSCSARLPVYTILIGLVVPHTKVLGIFNLQGMVLMALYLLGFFGTLIVSKVLSFIIKSAERTYFLMELPVYRAPRWKNIGSTMIEKARIFVTDAGKVIMVISVLLWALASYGPADRMRAVDDKYVVNADNLQGDDLSRARQTDKLEASWAGIMGHAIEPAIRPLGYDWKIGIALITSFAAREVFVGTMATLYSVGADNADEEPLRKKMMMAKRKDGTPVYTLATGLSLLVFYVFAMQCMSTLAIVKRETKTWKWPIVQFIYMTALAYLGAWLVYVLFEGM